jgi:hypothetical protein
MTRGSCLMCLKFLDLGNNPHPRTLCLSALAMEFGNGMVWSEGYWVVYRSMIMLYSQVLCSSISYFQGEFGIRLQSGVFSLGISAHFFLQCFLFAFAALSISNYCARSFLPYSSLPFPKLMKPCLVTCHVTPSTLNFL